MKVLFLPEYGEQIGGGHVMRCLTLAGELTRRGAEVAFAVKPAARPVIAAFADGMPIVADDWPADIAVLDGYGYTAADEQAFAVRGCKVAVFDDILRAHACDLIIDSGLGRTAADYPGGAKVLAGVSYSPVRPEFVAVRAAAGERRARGGARLLVSLGLTDVGGITARVLDLLTGLSGWDALDVVLGDTAASLSHARTLAAADPRITVHVNARNMADLTAAADFAVGAGGSSQWERAVVGVPTLLLILAENQKATARQLEVLRAALVLDVAAPDFDAAFAKAFTRLSGDAYLRASLSRHGQALFDGRGVERVAEAVLDLAS